MNKIKEFFNQEQTYVTIFRTTNENTLELLDYFLSSYSLLPNIAIEDGEFRSNVVGIPVFHERMVYAINVPRTMKPVLKFMNKITKLCLSLDDKRLAVFLQKI